jgi:hypothetical protein
MRQFIQYLDGLFASIFDCKRKVREFDLMLDLSMVLKLAQQAT